MSSKSHISDYTIVEVLGEGSFSTVYKAENNLCHQNVAIKVIPKSKILGPEDLRNLQSEIYISTMVDHPLIVSIYDVIEDDANFYIVMELISNNSLLHFVNSSGGLTEEQTKRIFCQLVSTLEYLHNEAHVVHRDLKAENVLIDRNSNIRLIDFGLSKMISKDKPYLQTICGSPAYTAPELLQGQPYTEAVDVWSLGILLFAMACGFLPFEDKNITLQLQKIISSEPEYPATLSASLVDLLKKLLTKDPRGRITLSKVKEHPWVSPQVMFRVAGEGIEPETRMTVNSSSFIDKDVVNTMTKLGIECKNLVKDLQSHDMTKTTAVYKLIRREKITDELHLLQISTQNHRWSNAKPRPGAISQGSLPRLESPMRASSRALGNAKGRENVLSVPDNISLLNGINQPKMVPSKLPKPLQVVDSPLLSTNFMVKRRTRAYTFMDSEIVRPRIEKRGDNIEISKY